MNQENSKSKSNSKSNVSQDNQDSRIEKLRNRLAKLALNKGNIVRIAGEYLKVTDPEVRQTMEHYLFEKDAGVQNIQQYLDKRIEPVREVWWGSGIRLPDRALDVLFRRIDWMTAWNNSNVFSGGNSSRNGSFLSAIFSENPRLQDLFLEKLERGEVGEVQSQRHAVTKRFFETVVLDDERYSRLMLIFSRTGDRKGIIQLFLSSPQQWENLSPEIRSEVGLTHGEMEAYFNANYFNGYTASLSGDFIRKVVSAYQVSSDPKMRDVLRKALFIDTANHYYLSSNWDSFISKAGEAFGGALPEDLLSYIIDTVEKTGTLAKSAALIFMLKNKPDLQNRLLDRLEKGMDFQSVKAVLNGPGNSECLGDRELSRCARMLIDCFILDREKQTGDAGNCALGIYNRYQPDMVTLTDSLGSKEIWTKLDSAVKTAFTDAFFAEANKSPDLLRRFFFKDIGSGEPERQWDITGKTLEVLENQRQKGVFPSCASAVEIAVAVLDIIEMTSSVNRDQKNEITKKCIEIITEGPEESVSRGIALFFSTLHYSGTSVVKEMADAFFSLEKLRGEDVQTILACRYHIKDELRDDIIGRIFDNDTMEKIVLPGQGKDRESGVMCAKIADCCGGVHLEHLDRWTEYALTSLLTGTEAREAFLDEISVSAVVGSFDLIMKTVPVLPDKCRKNLIKYRTHFLSRKLSEPGGDVVMRHFGESSSFFKSMMGRVFREDFAADLNMAMKNILSGVNRSKSPTISPDVWENVLDCLSKNLHNRNDRETLFLTKEFLEKVCRKAESVEEVKETLLKLKMDLLSLENEMGVYGEVQETCSFDAGMVL